MIVQICIKLNMLWGTRPQPLLYIHIAIVVLVLVIMMVG